jgi:predicted nucleotidyltransferase
MTTTLEQALTVLRANKAMLRERGVAHAAVFGSVARGEAREESDLDILVDLEPGKPSGMFEYVRLKHDIADLFTGKVDVIERAALRPGVRENVLKDVIDVF